MVFSGHASVAGSGCLWRGPRFGLARAQVLPRQISVLAARLVHLALYGFLLAMPLSGWLLLSAEGDPIAAFGLPLPALIGRDGGLAGRFEDLHEALATLGYLLIAVHAAAALAHHYVKHDGTLARMWPGGAGA
jgi:superoxide oxidase